jgi:hypothetical protein
MTDLTLCMQMGKIVAEQARATTARRTEEIYSVNVPLPFRQLAHGPRSCVRDCRLPCSILSHAWIQGERGEGEMGVLVNDAQSFPRWCCCAGHATDMLMLCAMCGIYRDDFWTQTMLNTGVKSNGLGCIWIAGRERCDRAKHTTRTMDKIKHCTNERTNESTRTGV